MRLHDRVSSSQLPFIVTNDTTGTRYRLPGVAELADEVGQSPLRYVLTDELVRVCIALAYSRGAKTLDCADLLHIPARSVWVEWCEKVHLEELARYGFKTSHGKGPTCGRRGVLVRADDLGRQGQLKVLWSTGPTELELFASPLTVRFDLDAGENPSNCVEHRPIHRDLIVEDTDKAGLGLLGRCFTFGFERAWANYYDDHRLPAADLVAIERDTLRTTAIDIPIVLVFFLLLNARNALRQRKSDLSKLNRARIRMGKRALLDHIEVHAPLIPGYSPAGTRDQSGGIRRSPRLHHVRGHLVRRGNSLHWRIPHLRGHARQGVIKSRTVSWIFERAGDIHLQSNAEVS